MVIISKRALVRFWTEHPGAKMELQAWHSEAKSADWVTPADIKATYRNASILKSGRVVFNISGNRYRLVAQVNYRSRTIYVRFIGTHKEYDAINAQDV